MDLMAAIEVLIPLFGMSLVVFALIFFIILKRKKRMQFKREIEQLPLINVIYTISGSKSKNEHGITGTSMGEYASGLQVGDIARYYVNSLSPARNGINLSSFDRKSEKPHIFGEVMDTSENKITIKGVCRLYNGQYLPIAAPFDARVTLSTGNWINLTRSRRRPTFSRKGGFLVSVKQI